MFPGQYGRLSNISAEGTFIEDELLVLKGKEIVRRAGESCGSLMCKWRELRDTGTSEERDLLSKFEIYQQPAGIVDGILVRDVRNTSWSTQP